MPAADLASRSAIAIVSAAAHTFLRQTLCESCFEVTDNLRGILAVLGGSTAFVLNDAIVKLVSNELPAGEILVVRGVLSTLLLILGVVLMRATRPLRLLFAPMMLVRLLSAAAATVFVVLSLRELPLATVIAVLQVTPLAVTAGASIVFGERVGWHRWLAALSGFAGVMLIVKPGGAFGAAAYILLTTLIFTTVRDLTTRGLDRDIPSIFVAAASAAVILLAGFAVAPFDAEWTMPSPGAWKLLCISATCLFFGNTLIIMALRTGEIAVIAPFRYAPMPLSILLGYWCWDDVPDTLASFGIALVLAAGLYTLHRERLARRPATAPVPQRSPAE